MKEYKINNFNLIQCLRSKVQKFIFGIMITKMFLCLIYFLTEEEGVSLKKNDTLGVREGEGEEGIFVQISIT